MARPSFGASALAAAWLAGGAVFAAFGLWNWTGSPERARYVRLGVVWGLFGIAQFATTVGRGRAGAGDRSAFGNWLLGSGVAMVSVGFVLSGTHLLGFGAAGLLLIAVAVLGAE